MLSYNWPDTILENEINDTDVTLRITRFLSLINSLEVYNGKPLVLIKYHDWKTINKNYIFKIKYPRLYKNSFPDSKGLSILRGIYSQLDENVDYFEALQSNPNPNPNTNVNMS